MPEYLAIAVLNRLRTQFNVQTSESRLPGMEGREEWQVEAISDSGKRWTVRHPSLVSACLRLAEKLEADLADSSVS